MASQDFDATAEPQALEDVLGLTNDTAYLVGNAGETPFLVRQAAAQPAATARGHVVAPYDDIETIPRSGEKTWVWSRHPDGAQVIVTEAD